MGLAAEQSAFPEDSHPTGTEDGLLIKIRSDDIVMQLTRGPRTGYAGVFYHVKPRNKPRHTHGALEIVVTLLSAVPGSPKIDGEGEWPLIQRERFDDSHSGRVVPTADDGGVVAGR